MLPNNILWNYGGFEVFINLSLFRKLCLFLFDEFLLAEDSDLSKDFN